MEGEVNVVISLPRHIKADPMQLTASTSSLKNRCSHTWFKCINVLSCNKFDPLTVKGSRMKSSRPRRNLPGRLCLGQNKRPNASWLDETDSMMLSSAVKMPTLVEPTPKADFVPRCYPHADSILDANFISGTDSTRPTLHGFHVTRQRYLTCQRQNGAAKPFALTLALWPFPTYWDFEREKIRGKSSLGLGLAVTLAYFVAWSPSNGIPGSSTQGDQSLRRATSKVGSSAQGSRSSRCSSSEASKGFPFKIWYNSNEDSSKDSFSWVDSEVAKIFSVLTRSSSLLGMANVICQCGPWSVKVSPCREGESINRWPTDHEDPFFYFYETLPLKLGAKLPFTHFEWLVLHALNVAPTLLHPNVRRAEKVGWTSFSNQPKQRLLKPFRESYKLFKNRFFRVAPNDAGPNLLMDNAGEPFFPYTGPHNPSHPVAPLSAAHLEGASQPPAEDASRSAPTIILDYPEGSPIPVDTNPP
ncbi:hypothetical protein CR513_43919, partial [Mucuna pruriens]